MIRNKYPTTTEVVEIGYSDHFAQIMNIVVNSLSSLPEFTKKRIFSKRSIDLFNSLLTNEVWEDVYHQTDVNRAYSLFLDKYEMYCFAVLFVSLLLFIHFIFYMIYCFLPFIVLGC
jgi:hypothetical protein